MKYIQCIFLIFSLFGCREEYLSGDLKGVIIAYDQYYNSTGDRSGTEVQIFRDSSEAGFTLTDEAGRYSFDDLPYGKFSIVCRKDGYVENYERTTIKHIGGGAPFFNNFGIYEVPYYSLHLDSIKPGENYTICFYLKIDGDTILRSKSTLQFVVFASYSPEVSKDNYQGSGKGYFFDWTDYTRRTKIAVHGLLSDNENIDLLSDSDSIYLVAYPLASGQGYGFWQFREGALGRPSNVIKCKWPR